MHQGSVLHEDTVTPYPRPVTFSLFFHKYFYSFFFLKLLIFSFLCLFFTITLNSNPRLVAFFSLAFNFFISLYFLFLIFFTFTVTPDITLIPG